MAPTDGVTMTREAAGLFSAIIASNVDQTKSITDSIIASLERDKIRLAKGLLDLVDELERIPDFARSATVDRALFRVSVTADFAHRIVYQEAE